MGGTTSKKYSPTHAHDTQQDTPSQTPMPHQRRFSRQSSHMSLPGHDGIPMANMRNSRHSINSAQSGKSYRSRTASRAEYHEDLKPELKQGLTRNLLFTAFIIVFGSSFQFGYGIGVLNQPSDHIKDFYNRTYTARNGFITSYTITFLWSLTTAAYIPGGMIGAFSAGFIADRMGRKKGLLFSHIFCFLGSIVSCLCVVAKAPELLIIGRVITGLNCGMATGISPMYLSEIAPYNLRGAFGTSHQLFITIGIFISSVFGLREILGSANSWQYLLVLNAIPALMSLCILPFLPESPRYLMLIRDERIEAEKALIFFRQHKDVSADMEEMETESHDDKKDKDETFTMKMLFQTSELRKPLFVACMLQVVQQLSGINAIFFYSGSIYRTAGVMSSSIQYAVMGTNAVNVIMTIIAVPVMDKAGRRPLLLFPMIIMVVDLIIITVSLNLTKSVSGMSFLSITCVIIYVICFAVGLGPIPQMVGAELFRQGPRPMAMSMAGVTNWAFTAVIAICFEFIQNAIKEFTFIIFLVLMVGFTVFVFFMVPETKNKTFEEIAHQFQPGDKIEVEEVVDDVFDEELAKHVDDDGPSEDTRLMVDKDDRENGDVSSSPNGRADGVQVKGRDEEKMSLTKSEENVGNLEV